MIRKNLLYRRLQPSAWPYSPVQQLGGSRVKSELALDVRPRIERQLGSGVHVHPQLKAGFGIPGKLEANTTQNNGANGSKLIRRLEGSSGGAYAPKCC